LCREKQRITVTPKWFLTALENRINAINWSAAVKDVEPFLKVSEKEALKLWSKEFFLDKLNKLQQILTSLNPSGFALLR
jgi:hypothetical protein